MAILRENDSSPIMVKPGLQRRFLHTENLMMVVIDFNNGPWAVPDPLHHHIHEQTTYIAEGEIIFLCEGEPDTVLKKGDMFSVPPNVPHSIQLLSNQARLIDSFNPVRTDFL
jgi:quercetin dioxygenase-like cupin family protein